MMNQEDIFKKIGQILNELNEQYQYLAQNPQELNELELELFLANSSFLSDHVQIIRKLNNGNVQKALPEHTGPAGEATVRQDVVLSVAPAARMEEITGEQEAAVGEEEEITDETVEEAPVLELPAVKPAAEQEMFKLDKEPSTFEFILNEKPSSDRFEFEEKSIDEIFDRPLSREEEEIIAQKQKLRENDSLENDFPEEDEIGPEPFLVSHAPEVTEETEPLNEEKTIPEPQVAKAEPEPFRFMQEGLFSVTEPVTEAEAALPEPAEEIFIQPAAENPAEPITTPVYPAAEPAAPPVKLTLNDILSGNTQPGSIRTESNRPPVTDLKQAISLNDKLRYIRDLFNGYNLAYAEAIDLLNKMPDFKTADTFLQKNYAAKHNWADKQETADHFYELLNQRFPVK